MTSAQKIGGVARNFADSQDAKRIQHADKVAQQGSKAARALRRAEKLAENNAYKESDGLLYAPGIAD
ncbi:hypothetical protein KPH14_012817 [Odynerus spinipes]|uniref:Uncharacterized protein n=1 Tax=Odynerus spinipes TaxID=1348599 RepID=A0AAD9VKL3_9HYME|nr:hypothetical protein KPH14_012817 [Odynerus spinipes]